VGERLVDAPHDHWAVSEETRLRVEQIADEIGG
jgi:hypothetical protein